MRTKPLITLISLIMICGFASAVVKAEDQRIAGVEYLGPGDLKADFNDFDYLIITHFDFYNSPELLDFATYRANYDNLRIAVTKVEDIYDDFPAESEIQSLKDFVSYAYHNWQNAPTYLLLVGDTSRRYQPVWGVPTHFEEDIEGQYENDRWIACVEGDDDTPDLLVGRFSVRTAVQLKNITDKIIHYEQSANTQTEPNNHAMAVEATAPSYPPYYVCQRFFLSGFNLTNYCNDATEYSKQDFIDNFGNTLSYINAHGSTQGYNPLGYPADPNIFSFNLDDIDNLNNEGQTPIILANSCSTGAITHLDREQNFAEKIVSIADKGAVAYYGGTAEIGLSSVFDDITDEIFDEFNYCLGSAIMQAELKNDSPQLKKMILHGDPGLHILGYKPVSGLPDLTLTSRDLKYDAREKVFCATIRNLGNVNAYNVPVEVYLYPTQRDEGVLLTSFVVNLVPANSSTSVVLEDVEQVIEGSDVYGIVKIDPHGTLSEISTLNNANGNTINANIKSIVTVMDYVGKPVSEANVIAFNSDHIRIDSGYTNPQGKCYLFLQEGIEVSYEVILGGNLVAISELGCTPYDVTLIASPFAAQIEAELENGFLVRQGDLLEINARLTNTGIESDFTFFVSIYDSFGQLVFDRIREREVHLGSGERFRSKARLNTEKADPGIYMLSFMAEVEGELLSVTPVNIYFQIIPSFTTK